MSQEVPSYQPPATGRLSLRTRLLIGLIALTVTIVVVMGAVGTVVMRVNLGRQFNGRLWSLVARPPGGLVNAPDDVAAVLIAADTGQRQAYPVNNDKWSNELASAFGQFAPHRQHREFTAVAPDGTALRAIKRQVAIGPLELAKIHLSLPPGRFMLVVGLPLRELDVPVRELQLAELIAGGAMLALLAVGGRWLIGRGLAPLDRMATAASLITSSGDLTARMPDADQGTETGKLAGAINTMLDRIQHAFAARWQSEQKVRTFAADASHELRTPLTTIRGYAELYRQGALGANELPDAMRRIEEEASRMSMLVAELLELARLDRTSSLNLTECDLAAVVRDAVADAAAVEPGRPVKAVAPDRLTVLADEPRMRQVLANLLANVREHTPSSTRAEIRLARLGRGVVMEVADAGPGMSPQDAAQAFDRFHRGARGGTGFHPAGSSGGAGLGLSIVQAIAAAHGGQAMLQSEPGRGTTVRVWLPNA